MKAKTIIIPTARWCAVDVAGLVAAGHLDLDEVFLRSDWRQVHGITAYTYGRDGDEPREVQIVLEWAAEYGIVAYRWSERDDGGTPVRGPTTLDRELAVADGEDYARENGGELDLEDLIRQIVASGYFGDADADDIRAVCEEATRYSQGYLLLPAGERPGRPAAAWTSNGYLQVPEYIALDATHPTPAYAAHSLLCSVRDEESPADE